MCPDRVQLHVLYRDTKRRLDAFASAVREGQHLDEAADFARYVLNCGLCDLLAQFPQGEPLPCDGHLLRGFAQDVLSACQERWRTGNTKPEVGLTELQAIRRNLDLIAGQVARMIPRVPVLNPAPCSTGGPFTVATYNVVPPGPQLADGPPGALAPGAPARGGGTGHPPSLDYIKHLLRCCEEGR